MLTILTVILLIGMFVVWKTVIIVPMREMCIVERLGKFRAALEPGFHFLIPFFDRVAYRHEAREPGCGSSGSTFLVSSRK